MQKEKNMKSKLSKIILGASISFGVVSVVTVASAAFVITGGDTAGTVTPSISVGDVTDNRIELKVNLNEGNSTIKLDAKQDDTSGIWQWDGTNYEDLTVGLDITVTGDPTLWTGVTVTASGALIEGDYLALDETIIPAGEHGQSGAGATVKLTNQTVTLKWGSAFNGSNPTEYFDTTLTESIDQVKTSLASMKSVAAGSNALTLTVTLNQPGA